MLRLAYRFSLAFALLLAFAPLPPAVAADAPSEDDYPAIGELPRVRLLDAGAEPRAPLRYRLKAGQHYSIRSTVHFTVIPGPFDRPGEAHGLPDFVVNGEVAVTAVAPDGAATVVVTFRHSRGDLRGTKAEHTRHVGEGYEQLGKVRAELTLDARGRCTHMDLPTPEGLGDFAQDLFASLRNQLPVLLGAYLPEEPIGVGGRWERLRTVQRKDLVSHERSRMTLAAREGDAVEISIASDTVLPGRDTTRGGRPVRVLSETRMTRSVAKGRLDSLAVAGTGSSERRVRSRALPDGPETEMTIRTESDFRVTPTAELSAFPARGAPPVVRLLDAGTEPRAPLRYQYDAGTQWEIERRARGTLQEGAVGQPGPRRPLPEAVQTGRFTVESVAPDGSAQVLLTLASRIGERGGAEMAVAERVAADFERLGVRKAQLTIDARGRCTAFEMPSPADLSRAQEHLMGEFRSGVPVLLTVALPDEPVGVGARWERLRTVYRRGRLHRERVVFELVSRDGAAFAIRSALDDEKPRRKVMRGTRQVQITAERNRIRSSRAGRLDSLAAEASSERKGTTRERILPDGEELEHCLEISETRRITPIPSP